LTSAATPIILRHVNKSYVKPPKLVVKNLSLSIRQGEIFCIIGPSGCGKSTVIKLIAGIEAPTSGEIVRPDHVGMVFQSYALLPWLTVEANVAFAGIIEAGLYQINVTVPQNAAAGDQPLLATVNGVQTPAGVVVTVPNCEPPQA